MVDLLQAYWLPLAVVAIIAAAGVAFALNRRRARKRTLDDIYPMF